MRSFKRIKTRSKVITEENEGAEDDDGTPLPADPAPFELTAKEKALKFLQNAPSAMNKVSSMSHRATSLVATLLMTKKNPIATGLAITAMLPDFMEIIASGSRIDLYEKALDGFYVYKGNICSTLHAMGILSQQDLSIRFQVASNKTAIINIKIDGEPVAAYYGSRTGVPHHGADAIFIKDGIEIEWLLRRLLERYILSPCAELTNGEKGITLKPVHFNGIYVGEHDPVKFANEVEKFRRKGLDHSVILHGPPGTGKTTFVMSYAELRRKRVLIVGPDALESTPDLPLYVDVLKPDILLLDDFDRNDSFHFAYTTLPSIKSRNPNMMVVITCNSPEMLGAAILRPGRGGQIIEFGPPSREDKLELFKTYLKYYDVSGREKIDIVKVIDSLSTEWTHDWIRHLAKMCVIFDQPGELEEFIGITTKQLKWIGDAETARKYDF